MSSAKIIALCRLDNLFYFYGLLFIFYQWSNMRSGSSATMPTRTSLRCSERFDVVDHRPVCPVDLRPVVGDVELPGDRGVDVPQPLADLLLRDPEFVGQRRPGVARPVEGQSLDVQLLGYCANRFLDPVVEGLVGRRLLGEAENVIRAGVAGDDLCSFRLDEDRHRVDVLAGGLRPHEVGPAVAQPVEVEQIHQVHAAHVE